MGRPRKTVQEILLGGNGARFTRAEILARAEEESLDTPSGQQAEVARLDKLIAEAMKACEKGQTLRNGRRNPAFGNLIALLKARKLAAEPRLRTSENLRGAMDLVDEMSGRKERQAS